MSTNHTPNFNLCQWEADDKVLRSDFNADNQKIDAALASVPKLIFGTYTGNGQYGEDAPTSLTLPFTPKLLLISNRQIMVNRKGVVGWFYGYTTGACDNDVNTEYVELTWNGNIVSWFSDVSADHQLNRANTVYHYCAIG